MIEPARPADLARIAALNHAAYAGLEANVASWRDPDFFPAAVGRIAARATFLVVREAGEVVGTVAYGRPGRSVDPVPHAWASVLLLAVDAAHRGRGHGRALTQTCLDWARRDEAPAVGLYTSAVMPAARRLYEDLGFRIERELPPRHGLRYWLYRHDLDNQVK